MWVNGDYTNGISVLDRLAARALETKKIADAMVGWLDELTPGNPSYTYKATPVTASGIGLTEAPRGALGHWIDITNSEISRYQVVTPTAWNASPRDDLDQPGPIEQALIGTPVAEPTKPIEVLRVVHSFDPCLACSVHMVRPGSTAELSVVNVRPSAG
jgi:hydrogenase large subunit